jgi:DNA polymerase-3 subunit epsilon
VANLTTEEKLDFITHSITIKKYQRFYLIVYALSTSFYSELLDMLPIGDHDAERDAFGKIIRAINNPPMPGMSFFDSAGAFYERMSRLGLEVLNHNNNFWFKTILVEKTRENDIKAIDEFIYRKNSEFGEKYSGQEMPYHPKYPTYTFIGGIFKNDYAHCSDNSCPCPNVVLMRHEGYIFIETINQGPKKIFRGNLVCEQGAKLRQLDLASAHEDALFWWDTGKIPNRVSIINRTPQSIPVRQSFTNESMENLNRQRVKEREDLAFRLQYGTKRENLVAFVDIETNALPINPNGALHDLNNWPHIVQIAWQLYTSAGNFVSKHCHLIRPTNFSINEGAFRIHGISNEEANSEGIQCQQALEKFNDAIKDATLIVGHNIEFDLKILKVEMVRNHIAQEFAIKKSFCTMLNSVEYCNLSNFRGLKYPSLKELYQKTFNRNFDGAHNAAADIQATAECFWTLKESGIFKIN